ncbi:MAG: hypothetical protein IJC50_03425 [Clostridia bacterium]|nr:hypothetical protein [Clostridia bacterium]
MDKKVRKKRLINGLIIIGVLLALLAIAYVVLSIIASEEIDYGYEFYEPDWQCDIMQDEEYLERGWHITYTNDMGESVAILDDNYAKFGIGVEFLSYYFAAIQSGDHEVYNGLFGDEYFEKNDPVETFTPQRIYDINIRFLSEEKIDDESFFVNYEIEYKIMRNDGTFRRDIGSDMARTQFLALKFTEDDIFISNISSVFAK